jgi:hypothetical protein
MLGRVLPSWAFLKCVPGGSLGCLLLVWAITRAMPYLGNWGIPWYLYVSPREFLTWGVVVPHINQGKYLPIIAGVGNNG